MPLTHDILDGLPQYFTPISRLGEGGMGVVWSVRDTRVNKVGALKIIRQKGQSESSISRFEREIRNFAQLMHPYIVQVYDVGQMKTGEPYIFMEQVNGRPISIELVRSHPFYEIASLLDKIIEGIGEAHSLGLVHRDLKPDNIMVTSDEFGHLIPKIMDFGLALRHSEEGGRLTCNGMVVGTPLYMAPEQACDEYYQLCPATDFYSIGCILYELFSGEPPFTGTSAVAVMVSQVKNAVKPFEPLPEFHEAKILGPIIMRLLEKLPDNRFDTAAEFRAELRRIGLIHDGLHFGIHALGDNGDTALDTVRSEEEEEIPFFSTELAPRTYSSILPEMKSANYNHSVLSLRSPVYVGRNSAKQVLSRYIRDAYECRRTAVALITGRPGVGKTRFLTSFIKDCYHQGTAASLIVDGSSCANLRLAVYKALFAKLMLKKLTPQQIVSAFCRFLKTRATKDPRVQALVTLYHAFEKQKPLRLERMDELLTTVFQQLSQKLPLVLVFDNVKPEQKLELCAIARELTEADMHWTIMMCIVNSTINDIPTDIELALGNECSLWLRREIPITPLSNADMHTLITNSLGISEDLAGFIENISTGLPQIAVELARQWQLAGFLEPTEHGYSSRQPLETLPIPHNVHMLILQQLNLTFADYQPRLWNPVASVAALFGDRFTPPLLARALRCLPTTQRLMNHSTFISLALAGGVLKTLDESTLTFSNPLLRDALSTVLQPYEEQDYHRAIAAARSESPQSYENDKEIARHLELAHQDYDAFYANLRLARQFVLLGLLPQAREYCTKAENNLKQHLGFIDIRTPEMTEIRLVETDIALEKNNFEEANQKLKWLELASEFMNQPLKQAQLMILKSRKNAANGNHIQAEALLRQALDEIARLSEPLSQEQLEVKFSALITLIPYDPSFSHAIIETARRLQDVFYIGKAFLAIARHCIAINDTQRATRILNMAIDNAHQNNDIRTEGNALLMLSHLKGTTEDVRLKTLSDATKDFEVLGDFAVLSQIHREIGELLLIASPSESKLHRQWSALLA